MDMKPKTVPDASRRQFVGEVTAGLAVLATPAVAQQGAVPAEPRRVVTTSTPCAAREP